MIWIIPALVFAAGCLAVAIWALMKMYREKARRLKCEEDSGITDQMIEEHAARANRVVELLTEISTLRAQRDTHKLQAETALAQLDSVATALSACMLERDALQLKLDEALKPRTRASRAKPPLNE